MRIFGLEVHWANILHANIQFHFKRKEKYIKILALLNFVPIYSFDQSFFFCFLVLLWTKYLSEIRSAHQMCPHLHQNEFIWSALLHMYVCTYIFGKYNFIWVSRFRFINFPMFELAPRSANCHAHVMGWV